MAGGLGRYDSPMSVVSVTHLATGVQHVILRRAAKREAKSDAVNQDRTSDRTITQKVFFELNFSRTLSQLSYAGNVLKEDALIN